jgi:hypothetical protein
MSKENIVVLGSKPQAPLPAVAAPRVLTANNAVELGALYRQKYGSRVIAFVPIIELRKHEHIRQSFIKARPDEVILIGGEEADVAYVKNEVGLHEAKVSLMSWCERNRTMARALGWRRFLVHFEALRARGLRYVLTHTLLDLLGKRDMEWLAQSTGFNTIFYALKHFPGAEVISAGMGLQGGGHFSGQGEFMSKTAKADQITIKHWPPHMRPNVFTTDDVMAELAPMQKWQGEVFYLKSTT